MGNRLVRAQPPAWPHAIGNAIALILATFNKNTYLQAQFLRLQARRGPKKAAIAVAASILTAIYHAIRLRLEDALEYAVDQGWFDSNGEITAEGIAAGKENK